MRSGKSLNRLYGNTFVYRAMYVVEILICAVFGHTFVMSRLGGERWCSRCDRREGNYTIV